MATVFTCVTSRFTIRVIYGYRPSVSRISSFYTSGAHLRENCNGLLQLYSRVEQLTSVLPFHRFYCRQGLVMLHRSLVIPASNKAQKEYRLNNAIKAKNVRLIDQNGANLGVISLQEALKRGKKENCMVFQVRQTNTETVCKLISAKHLYEMKKEEKRKQIKTSRTREIKVTGKISDHDLDIKLKKIVEFLEERDSVKIFVAHRKMQNASMDDKRDLVEKIAKHIREVGILQGDIKVVGNSVRAIFIPLQKK